MRMKINQKIAGGASAAIGSMTRRSFLAASAAAAVPTVAVAEAAMKTDRLPQSLESQMDDCVAQLRAILMQMHPEVNVIHHHMDSRRDGSFRLTLQGDRKFIEYDGPGIYLASNRISEVVECWIERFEEINVRTGQPIPGCFYYRSVECVGGVPIGEVTERSWPKLIEKLKDGAFPIVEEGGY